MNEITPFLPLSLDLLSRIATYLPSEDQKSLSATSRQFHFAVKFPPQSFAGSVFRLLQPFPPHTSHRKDIEAVESVALSYLRSNQDSPGNVSRRTLYESSANRTFVAIEDQTLCQFSQSLIKGASPVILKSLEADGVLAAPLNDLATRIRNWMAQHTGLLKLLVVPSDLNDLRIPSEAVQLPLTLLSFSSCLFKSSDQNQLYTVAALLNSGERIDFLTAKNSFMIAIANGHLGIVWLFLNSDVYLSRDTMEEGLKAAIECNETEIVQLFLNHRKLIHTDAMSRSLETAIEKDHTQIIQLLLNSKRLIDLDDIRRIFCKAVENGKHEIVLLFFRSGRRITLEAMSTGLTAAIENCDSRMVKALLNSGRPIQTDATSEGLKQAISNVLTLSKSKITKRESLAIVRYLLESPLFIPGEVIKEMLNKDGLPQEIRTLFERRIQSPPTARASLN